MSSSWLDLSDSEALDALRRWAHQQLPDQPHICADYFVCGVTLSYNGARLRDPLPEGWQHCPEKNGVFYLCPEARKPSRPWLLDLDLGKFREYMHAKCSESQDSAFLLDFNEMRRVCAPDGQTL